MYFIFTYTNKHIYLQNQTVIYSSKTFLQAVWLPAGKSILFFSFEKERNMSSSSPVTQQLYQFVFRAVISIIVVDYLHLAQNRNTLLFFTIEELCYIVSSSYAILGFFKDS